MGFSIAFYCSASSSASPWPLCAARAAAHPLLRLLGMRKAANDIEMDLSLRPQNAGQSHEEPTAVGWS